MVSAADAPVTPGESGNASVATPDEFWEKIEPNSDLWTVARTCDVAPDQLLRFYEMFVAHPRTVTMFSQGINQALRGTDGRLFPLGLPRLLGRRWIIDQVRLMLLNGF